jgi:hypothetical protein
MIKNELNQELMRPPGETCLQIDATNFEDERMSPEFRSENLEPAKRQTFDGFLGAYVHHNI